MTCYVLIHSPVTGPRTWAPVAERLRAAGCEVAVPSLLGIGEGNPPFWPRAVAAVTAAAEGAAPGEPLVLAAHSGAGVLLPAIAAALPRPVRCSVFVDATVPARTGVTPVVPGEFLEVLAGLAGPDGRLPRWTDWWADQDVAPLFPDAATREAVTAELPRLPLAFYREQVPVPTGWDPASGAYLHFSAAYDGEAREAAERGWPVRTLPGEHLHQLVDPAGVATVLRELAGDSGAGDSGT
jgi:hypothetical protein